MKIKMTAIPVDDQQKALDFYTKVLGFEKKQDIPMGEFRWLSVIAPEGNDTELSLEPNVNPASKAFQESLLEQGIPMTGFEVDDMDAEFERLKAQNVVFTTDPKDAGPVRMAVFLDTCGNLIQIYQHKTD
ncbi:MAG: VOC family protein [Pseudomonadota bacterium]